MDFRGAAADKGNKSAYRKGMTRLVAVNRERNTERTQGERQGKKRKREREREKERRGESGQWRGPMK